VHVAYVVRFLQIYVRKGRSFKVITIYTPSRRSDTRPPLNIIPLIRIRLRCPDLNFKFAPDVLELNKRGGICRTLEIMVHCAHPAFIALVTGRNFAGILVDGWHIELVFRELPHRTLLLGSQMSCTVPDLKRFGLVEIHREYDLRLDMSMSGR